MLKKIVFNFISFSFLCYLAMPKIVAQTKNQIVLDSITKLVNQKETAIEKIVFYKSLLDVGARKISFDDLKLLKTKAIALATENNLEEEIADINYYYTRVLYENADVQGALKNNEKVLAIGKVLKNDSIIAKYYYGKGWIEISQGGNSETVKGYYQRALHQIINMPVSKFRAHILNGLGVVAFLEKKEQEAYEFYLRALREVKGFDDPEFQAMLYNNIGIIFINHGEYEEAFRMLNKALELSKNNNNEAAAANYLYNIGNFKRREGKIKEAIQYCTKAYHKAKEFKNYRFLIDIEIELGFLLTRQGNYTQAQKYFEEGLQYAEKFKLEEEIVFLKIGIQTNNYFLTNNKSLLKLRKEMALIAGIDNASSYKTDSYQLLGEFFFKLKNYPEALKNLNASKELKIKNKQYSEIFDDLDRISKSYQALKDYGKAYATNTETIDLLETLEKLSKTKELVSKKLKLRFDEERGALEVENEKKSFLSNQKLKFQNRIIIGVILLMIILIVVVVIILNMLRQNKILNSKLNIQHGELQKANKTKDKLFAILGHDLRSPFTSLRSLVTLIQEGILKKEDISEHLITSSRYIDSIHGSLENILYWAKNQLDGFVVLTSAVSLKEVLEDVINFTKQQAHQKNITIDVSVALLHLVHCDTQQLHLVFRNLISNAIKFTPIRGRISIGSVANGSKIIISISDTGIGMDENTLKNLFNKEGFEKVTYGTQGEKGTGLGLILSKEFIDENDGEIWAESKLGVGTTFYISLPSYQKKENNTSAKSLRSV